MPRYLFDARPTDRLARERAARLAVERFPEVEVEHSYVVWSEGSSHEVWICRAPSQQHLRRWAAAADITVDTVQQVDTDIAPT